MASSLPPNVWLWGRNRVPVYVVREADRRWAVWSISWSAERGGERWGHFRLMRDAHGFARAVVDGRAFTSTVGLRMVPDPSRRRPLAGG